MCCPNIKHGSDSCCKLEAKLVERSYRLTALEETIRVLQAECKRLSEELARSYE